MAKKATRKKTVRAARRVTGMAAMPTKSWEGAKYYVHYMVEGREWGSTIKSWIKKHYTKEEASAVNRLPDYKVNMYSHWATTAYLMENEPTLVPETYKQGIVKWVNGLVEEGKKIVAAKALEEAAAAKKKIPQPTIQDRLRDAAYEKVDEIEEWIDAWIEDPKANPLKDKTPVNSLKGQMVNVGHCRFIEKMYEGQYQEFTELLNLPPKAKRDDMQEQLAEGYSHLSKAQIKEAQGFFQRIMQALEIIRAEKKQTRAVRKPKQKSAQDLVKKLKFKPSDPDMGIASINPADIIGAEAIVVFNCKNRKLGIYYAQEYQTLSVKGTTLQFFDEAKSLQKTVRKPDEVLPNWKKITKHKLKAQFGYLKTTDTKMNGRLNDETVILKAFK